MSQGGKEGKCIVIKAVENVTTLHNKETKLLFTRIRYIYNLDKKVIFFTYLSLKFLYVQGRPKVRERGGGLQPLPKNNYQTKISHPKPLKHSNKKD